jgi:hypothetical protein
LDKNTPNRDVDIPNADNHNPFTSWGKNPLESRNRDAECFGAYMDKSILFADKNGLNKDINILNTDILIPFLSGEKNAPVGGNHITDHYDTYQDKYVLFQCVIDLNKIDCVPFVSYYDLNKSYMVPIISRADPYTDRNIPFPDGMAAYGGGEKRGKKGHARKNARKNSWLFG